MIRIVSYVILAIVLTSCEQLDNGKKPSANPPPPRVLTGTWLSDFDDTGGWHRHARLVAASNGSYHSDLTFTSSNRTHLIHLDGTLRVEGETLIDTVTNQTPAHAPLTNGRMNAVFRSRITWINDREMVVSNETLVAASNACPRTILLRKE